MSLTEEPNEEAGANDEDSSLYSSDLSYSSLSDLSDGKANSNNQLKTDFQG